MGLHFQSVGTPNITFGSIDKGSDQTEVGLGRLAKEVTSPELLLGMTAGGLAYRVGRLAGLSGLSRAALCGRPLGLLAGGSGLLAEASAFTLASRATRKFLGETRQLHQPGLWQEWSGAVLMLGMLRATGMGVRGIHGLVAGGEAKGLGMKLSQLGATQLGMYGGILLSDSLEQRLGRRPTRSREEMLTQGLALLLHFNLAGVVAGKVLGPMVKPWELSLEKRAREQEFQASPSLVLAPQLVGAGGAELFDPGPVAVFMSTSGKGNSGSGKGGTRRSLPTMQFSPEEARRMRKAAGLMGKDPTEVDSPLKLIMRIQDKDLGFVELLKDHDVEFTLRGNFPEESQARVLDLLNLLAESEISSNSETAKPIPGGRKVVVKVESEEAGQSAQRHVFVLQSTGFQLIAPGTAARRARRITPRNVAPATSVAETSPNGSLAKRSAGQKDPYEFENVYFLMESLDQMPRLESFEWDLMRINLNITLKDRGGFETKALLRRLNQLPWVLEIPEGRKVRISFGTGYADFIKINDRFECPFGIHESKPPSVR